jgi:hypothetical protein
MKVYGGVDDKIHSFLSSVRHGGEWSGSHARKIYGGVDLKLHNSYPQYEMEVNGQLHLSAIIHPVPTEYGTGWAPHPEYIF